MRSISNAVYLSIALIWLGMIFGVSFLATPVKFTAPSLFLSAALDVGRVTFALFSKVEWGLCALLLLASLLSGWRTLSAVVILFLVVILIGQALWILPELNARVAAVIAGNPRPPSIHHTVYAVAEIIKVVALAILAAEYFLRSSGTVRL